MAVMAGDLVTRLGLDARKFQNGLKNAQTGLQKFAAGAKTAMVGVGVAFAGATAGLAAIAGGAYVLSGRIAKLAAVADESVKTGLSGEFLQRLGYAADQSGISMETLTAATKKLTIAIGGGNKGISEIGLNLAALQAMTPEEQFRAVAEKISSIPTAAGRAAAAVKVFGKSGVDMTGLFAGGMKDLNKLLQEARDLGIGVSDEDLKRAAAADDAIQKMKATFGALADKVAITFAPALESVANAISGWMGPINKAMDAFNAMPDKWTWLGDTMVAAFDVAFEKIKLGFVEMIASLTKATGDFSMTVSDIMLNPAATGVEFGAAAMRAGQLPGSRPGGLEGAQQRLAAQMAALSVPDIGLAGMPGIQKKMGGPGTSKKPKGSGDFAGLFGAIGGQVEGPMAALKQGLQNKFTEAKSTAGWLGSLVAQMLGIGGEKLKTDKTPTITPQLAGAMGRGSAEAYSTIAQAMLRGGKDPVVQATEKQTQILVKHLKPKPSVVFEMIGDFLT